MKFETINAPPESLRHAYLDSIAEPQELFLENFVVNGNVWISGDSIYAVAYENMLVELYIAPESTEGISVVFDATLQASGATEVLCKSFDTQLLYAAFSKKCTAPSCQLQIFPNVGVMFL